MSAPTLDTPLNGHQPPARGRGLRGGLRGLSVAAGGLRRAAPRAWSRARGAVLTLAGFGCLSGAAWTVDVTLGLAAVGVSLLIVEYLSEPEGRR